MLDNLNIDLDLLKFENSFVMDIRGKQQTKHCVCIPIEENDLYISKNEQTGRAKAAYVHLTAWKSQEEKFGQTHYVKQAMSKEWREAHTKEELKARAILGNGKPAQFENNNAAQSVNAPTQIFDPNNGIDDLSF